MNTIKQLIEKYCPDGVEYKKLGEIGTFERGKNIQKTDFLDEGFPCIHYGQIYTYYKLFTSKTIKFVDSAVASKATIAHPGDVIITTTSENMEDVGTPLGWLGNTDVAISGHSVVFHHQQDTKYVTYFIASSPFAEQKKRYARGAKVIDIKATDLEKIEIPVPPLPVQREIVRILDSFTSLEAELEAELEARRKQYEYYRDQLLSFKHLSGGGKNEVEWKTLGEVAEIVGGRDYKQFNHGNIPVYGSGGIMTYIDTYAYDRPTVLLPRKGSISNVFYTDMPFWNVDTIFYTIIHNELLPKFFYYYMCNYHIERLNTSNAARPALTRTVLNNIPIPIPPLSTQRRIVSILDRFESLVNDISTGLPAEIAARHQQYEYYRDQLLSFKRKS